MLSTAATLWYMCHCCHISGFIFAAIPWHLWAMVISVQRTSRNALCVPSWSWPQVFAGHMFWVSWPGTSRYISSFLSKMYYIHVQGHVHLFSHCISSFFIQVLHNVHLRYHGVPKSSNQQKRWYQWYHGHTQSPNGPHQLRWSLWYCYRDDLRQPAFSETHLGRARGMKRLATECLLYAMFLKTENWMNNIMTI